MGHFTWFEIHILFDFLAAGAGLVIGVWFRHICSQSFPHPVPEVYRHKYIIALLTGAVAGAYLFGTLNGVLSLEHAGEFLLGKSVLGAIIGGIIGTELFKWRMGIRGSTGLVLVPSLALGIAVGRLGCFFSGLPDFTYGIPTNTFFGYDFGDGVFRHPVQLYESVAMFVFLIAFLIAMKNRSAFWLRNGFYLFILFYATQRFAWEFLKPYVTVAGGLNLFQWLAFVMGPYALGMIASNEQRLKIG